VALVKGVFFDTSVLLSGLIELGPASRNAHILLDQVAASRGGRPLTAWHCCLEFYSVATRLPEELRLTPADAFVLLESEVFGRFDVRDLPAAARQEFLRSAAREGIRGGRLYDRHIAEIARRSGSRVVVTDNGRHFQRLEAAGVRVVSATEFLAEARKR